MGLRPLSPVERPPLALKPPGNEESDGDAGLRRLLRDSSRFGGGKHRLWLFTPAYRRPRTAFGISLRAEALHPLQVARTSEKVRKTASGGATSKGAKRFETGGNPVNKKPNRTKSVPLTFYVTDADSQRIHRKAKACGVSLTKYLTDCAVGKEIIRIDALTEFTKALKAQGNNLNQLTTLANMGRITAVNVQEACALYADIQRSLKTLLERTV